jgi:hypothetical protein
MNIPGTGGDKGILNIAGSGRDFRAGARKGRDAGYASRRQDLLVVAMTAVSGDCRRSRGGLCKDAIRPFATSEGVVRKVRFNVDSGRLLCANRGHSPAAGAGGVTGDTAPPPELHLS